MSPRPSLHTNVAGRERELLAMSDEVRRLVRVVTGNTLSRAATAEAAARLAALADDLEAGLPDTPPHRYAMRGMPSDPQDFFPYDPVVGPYNPLALPLELGWEDPRVVGRARFDTPYEGPPGCVHGAVLAGVFDQLLNAANLMARCAGPTAQLRLTFEKPTPLHAELRFESWIESLDGRKVTTVGHALHDGEVTVRARGLFVALTDRDLDRMSDR